MGARATLGASMLCQGLLFDWVFFSAGATTKPILGIGPAIRERLTTVILNYRPVPEPLSGNIFNATGFFRELDDRIQGG